MLNYADFLDITRPSKPPFSGLYRWLDKMPLQEAEKDVALGRKLPDGMEAYLSRYEPSEMSPCLRKRLKVPRSTAPQVNRGRPKLSHSYPTRSKIYATQYVIAYFTILNEQLEDESIDLRYDADSICTYSVPKKLKEQIYEQVRSSGIAVPGFDRFNNILCTLHKDEEWAERILQDTILQTVMNKKHQIKDSRQWFFRS